MYSLYIISLLMSSIAIFAKNRKFSLLIGILIMSSIVVIMMNANEGFWDLANYNRAYKFYGDMDLGNINKCGAETGYVLVAFLCAKIGLSFTQFRLVIFSVCFILIFSVLNKYTKKITFFTTFYMLHSMFLDGEQLRNYIAFSIIIYAVPFLCEKSKNGTRKYIFYVMIASLFHTMALGYLIFLVLNMNKAKLKKILRIIPGVIIIVLVLVSCTSLLSNILLFISNFFKESIAEKIVGYAGKKSRLGFMIPTIIYFSYCLFIRYINRRAVGKRFQCISGFYQQICNMNYIGLSFLPLCVLSLTFYRLVRNICLLDLVYFASVFEHVSGPVKKMIVLAGVFFLILGWRIFDFRIYFDWESFCQTYFGL